MLYTSQTDIENYSKNYFQNLWSSSLSYSLDSLFSALPDDLGALSEEDKEVLIKPLSKREVHRTLLSIPRSKSPSTDYVNVEFYVFY